MPRPLRGMRHICVRDSRAVACYGSNSPTAAPFLARRARPKKQKYPKMPNKYLLLLLLCCTACRTPFEQLTLQEQVERYNRVNFSKEYLFDVPTLNLGAPQIAAAHKRQCEGVDSAAYARMRQLSREEYVEVFRKGKFNSRLNIDDKHQFLETKTRTEFPMKSLTTGFAGGFEATTLSGSLTIQFSTKKMLMDIKINPDFSKQMHRYRYQRKKQAQVHELTLIICQFSPKRQSDTLKLRNGNIFQYENIYYKVIYDPAVLKAAHTLNDENGLANTFLGEQRRSSRENAFIAVNSPILFMPILPAELPVCKDMFLYPDSLGLLQLELSSVEFYLGILRIGGLLSSGDFL